MNFKKYHVSKNLLNIDRIRSDTFTLDTVYYLNGVAFDTLSMNPSTTTAQIHDNAITIQTSSYYGVGFVVPVENGKTYHLTFNCDTSASSFGGITRLTENGSIQKYSIIYSNSASVSITSTDTRYILIVLRCINQTAIFSNIMLNEGASAQPYEPYSSEVWHDIPHYIHNTSTDTLTTLPAIIYPNDTTATVGLKGNTVQSGTPTPQNPIQPSECGERTGNLFELTDSSATANIIDTLVDLGADVTFDTITCSCVFDNLEAEGLFGAFIDYRMDDGTHQYVALSSMSNVNDNTGVPINVKVNGNYYNTKKNITFRRIQVYLSTTGYNKFKSGSIKWAFYDSENKYYEPYGYKIPISSANTTTPVYLGEVESTRRVKKLVLTGEENITSGHLDVCLFNISIDDYIREPIISLICTHYKATQNVLEWSHVPDKNTCFYVGIIVEFRQLYIRDSSYSTIADFKAYLAAQYAAGTPVCVWYVLAEPETGIVNEPIRKIGDYADTVSGITIPTIAGANTISVGTTLQPSEVSVNYHGWHPVLAVHERENGAWD